jgi:hypothetical protein
VLMEQCKTEAVALSVIAGIVPVQVLVLRPDRVLYKTLITVTGLILLLVRPREELMPLQVITHLQEEVQHSGITAVVRNLHPADQVKAIQYLQEEVQRVHHHLTHQVHITIPLQAADHLTAADLPIPVPEVHFLQVHPPPAAPHQEGHHQAGALHQAEDHHQEADLLQDGDRLIQNNIFRIFILNTECREGLTKNKIS